MIRLSDYLHHELNSACVRISPEKMTVDEIVAVARHDVGVEISKVVHDNVSQTRVALEKQIDNEAAYYGITTGFGSLASYALPKEKSAQLSRNLITSHSIALGPKFPPDVVRAATLIRLKSLSHGYSGVRPDIIDLLASGLNAGLYPSVPSQGSLGACGDLCCLSHLTLAFTRHPDDTDDGSFFVPVEQNDDVSKYDIQTTRDYVTNEQKVWKSIPASTVLGDQRIVLSSKEGLAMNNGATFSAAIAALLTNDMERILRSDAPAALAIALEAVEGVRDSFLSAVVNLRPHPGSLTFSDTMRRLTYGSKSVTGSLEENPGRIPPQEPYSIRCATAAFGGFWQSFKMLKEAVDIEINSVTDNPLFFADQAQGVTRDYSVLSGGNFHGDPIAIPLDSASLALTKLGSLLERLTFKLTDWSARGLPPYLIGTPEYGLNSGLMIAQYTSASLVNECQTLVHPASANSIPSSANQEDYVSMSLNSAKNATTIRDNVEKIVAIALFTACQAIDVAEGKPLERMAPGTRAIYNVIRTKVQPVTIDRVMHQDIDAILLLMRSGVIDCVVGDFM